MVTESPTRAQFQWSADKKVLNKGIAIGVDVSRYFTTAYGGRPIVSATL